MTRTYLLWIDYKHASLHITPAFEEHARFKCESELKKYFTTHPSISTQKLTKTRIEKVREVQRYLTRESSCVFKIIIRSIYFTVTNETTTNVIMNNKSFSFKPFATNKAPHITHSYDIN